jgi:hypothetical protein
MPDAAAAQLWLMAAAAAAVAVLRHPAALPASEMTEAMASAVAPALALLPYYLH